MQLMKYLLFITTITRNPITHTADEMWSF